MDRNLPNHEVLEYFPLLTTRELSDLPEIVEVPQVPGKESYYPKSHALYDQGENRILLVKSKWTKSGLAHELGHHFLSHGPIKSPEDYIRWEIQAEKWAHRKYPEQRPISDTMYGWFLFLQDWYALPNGEALDLLSTELQKARVPKGWGIEFRRIKAYVEESD